ncbi:3-isopropylmalate dehydrogenase [bacterium C-53]|nr:3-isopropylmalate dehydrogenase [Lachnospiraceae bacterium]NBI01774.1 3-isopropylmalate dehydrogenase [Lachnospiraceae bacterium]RKJ12192.1 3-isopropylmalate dehydrogenase [bacterium C-53]
MEYKIGSIAGDGIGPEIVREARKIIDRIAEKYGHKIKYEDILLGGASIDATGVPLTEEAVAQAKSCNCVLMGSIGGDTSTSPWYRLAPNLRPEAGLLGIRKALNLFANLRPAVLYDELASACPLKEEIIGDGFDMLIMRELTGGLYFGERRTVEENGKKTAVDTLTYSEDEIRRIAVKAFDIAGKRRRKVTSVDKANVLDSSRLWRQVVEEVAKDYPDIALEHMLVDNCAMQLVRDPGQFDVILTENMFGDILSDEASMVTGSIGMLASASLNDTKFGLYEPSHGSAPDIAGQNKANPIATILSAAMMLRFSLDLDKEADDIERAVKETLASGYRTGDILSDGCQLVGCSEMGSLIAERI